MSKRPIDIEDVARQEPPAPPQTPQDILGIMPADSVIDGVHVEYVQQALYMHPTASMVEAVVCGRRIEAIETLVAKLDALVKEGRESGEWRLEAQLRYQRTVKQLRTVMS